MKRIIICFKALVYALRHQQSKNSFKENGIKAYFRTVSELFNNDYTVGVRSLKASKMTEQELIEYRKKIFEEMKKYEE